MKDFDEEIRIIEDGTAYFRLHNVISAFSIGEIDKNSQEFKDAFQDIERFRRHLNHKQEVLYPSWLEFVAKSEIFDLFPKPSTEDKGYTDWYNLLVTIRDRSLLAHRFEISGRYKLGEIEFNVDGGYLKVMVPQMFQSFARFVNSDGKRVVDGLLNSEFGSLGENQLSEVLHQVSEDVQQCILDANNDLIAAKSQNNQILLLAPSIKYSPDSFHAISMSVHGNLCLIADKARDVKPGIEIYQMQGSSDHHRKQIPQIAAEIVKNIDNHDPNAPSTTSEKFSGNMMKLLNMKQIDFIPLQSQYGENCTWSSCSKSVLLSALYFRLYDAAKETQAIKKLPPNQQDALARKLASSQAKEIQHQWANYDKYEFLRSYINQSYDVNKPEFGPDPVLLAYILMKYEFRNKNQNIVKLIKDSGLVQEQHIKQAKEIAYKQAEVLLQEEYPIIYKVFSSQINEIARKFADLYMLSNKKNVEKVFSSISFLSFSPFKNAIQTLDKAIIEAKQKPTKIPQRPNALQFTVDPKEKKDVVIENKEPKRNPAPSNIRPK